MPDPTEEEERRRRLRQRGPIQQPFEPMEGLEFGGPVREQALATTPSAVGGEKFGLLEQAAAAGGGFPSGLLEFDEWGDLMPNSKIYLDYWRDLQGASQQRRTTSLAEQRFAFEQGKEERSIAKEQADERRLIAEQQALQLQQQQAFLLALLQNPGAMAAFQLLRGAGRGGGLGANVPFLGSPPSPFGFNAFMPVSAGANPETGEEEFEAAMRPTGSPLASFFGQGALPRLNELSADPQGQQALEGLLSLFGILPQQLQQASARQTPRPFQGSARASFALPAPRR